MSYPLEFTANQQEMLGAELKPEPLSIGGKMKKKMLDGPTVEVPLRQAVDVGRLYGRKTSSVWRIGMGILGPFTHSE